MPDETGLKARAVALAREFRPDMAADATPEPGESLVDTIARCVARDIADLLDRVLPEQLPDTPTMRERLAADLAEVLDWSWPESFGVPPATEVTGQIADELAAKGWRRAQV